MATRVAYVPYTIPGFALAKSVADVFDKNPKVEGLVLLQHGIFTVGDNAKQAYERMIEFVTLAEERLQRGSASRCAAGQAARQHRARCPTSRPSCAARWRSRRMRWPAPPSGRSCDFRTNPGDPELCERRGAGALYARSAW